MFLAQFFQKYLEIARKNQIHETSFNKPLFRQPNLLDFDQNKMEYSLFLRNIFADTLQAYQKNTLLYVSENFDKMLILVDSKIYIFDYINKFNSKNLHTKSNENAFYTCALLFSHTSILNLVQMHYSCDAELDILKERKSSRFYFEFNLSNKILQDGSVLQSNTSRIFAFRETLICLQFNFHKSGVYGICKNKKRVVFKKPNYYFCDLQADHTNSIINMNPMLHTIFQNKNFLAHNKENIIEGFMFKNYSHFPIIIIYCALSPTYFNLSCIRSLSVKLCSFIFFSILETFSLFFALPSMLKRKVTNIWTFSEGNDYQRLIHINLISHDFRDKCQKTLDNPVVMVDNMNNQEIFFHMNAFQIIFHELLNIMTPLSELSKDEFELEFWNKNKSMCIKNALEDFLQQRWIYQNRKVNLNNNTPLLATMIVTELKEHKICYQIFGLFCHDLLPMLSNLQKGKHWYDNWLDTKKKWNVLIEINKIQQELSLNSCIMKQVQRQVFDNHVSVFIQFMKFSSGIRSFLENQFPNQLHAFCNTVLKIFGLVSIYSEKHKYGGDDFVDDFYARNNSVNMQASFLQVYGLNIEYLRTDDNFFVHISKSKMKNNPLFIFYLISCGNKKFKKLMKFQYPKKFSNIYNNIEWKIYSKSCMTYQTASNNNEYAFPLVQQELNYIQYMFVPESTKSNSGYVKWCEIYQIFDGLGFTTGHMKESDKILSFHQEYLNKEHYIKDVLLQIKHENKTDDLKVYGKIRSTDPSLLFINIFKHDKIDSILHDNISATYFWNITDEFRRSKSATIVFHKKLCIIFVTIVHNIKTSNAPIQEFLTDISSHNISSNATKSDILISRNYLKLFEEWLKIYLINFTANIDKIYIFIRNGATNHNVIKFVLKNTTNSLVSLLPLKMPINKYYIIVYIIIQKSASKKCLQTNFHEIIKSKQQIHFISLQQILFYFLRLMHYSHYYNRINADLMFFNFASKDAISYCVYDAKDSHLMGNNTNIYCLNFFNDAVSSQYKFIVLPQPKTDINSKKGVNQNQSAEITTNLESQHFGYNLVFSITSNHDKKIGLLGNCKKAKNSILVYLSIINNKNSSKIIFFNEIKLTKKVFILREKQQIRSYVQLSFLILFDFSLQYMHYCLTDFDCRIAEISIYARRLNKFNCFSNCCGVCLTNGDCGGAPAICDIEKRCKALTSLTICQTISFDYGVAESNNWCNICVPGQGGYSKCPSNQCNDFNQLRVCGKLCYHTFDCPHTMPLCSNGQCLDCTANSHCTAFGFNMCQIVVSSYGICKLACTTDSHCNGIRLKPYCISSLCSTCLNDEWCQTYKTMKVCHYTQGICLPSCTSSALSCLNPAKSVCSGGYCIGCETNGDCSHILSYKYCASGICKECTTNSDCTVINAALLYCISNFCKTVNVCKSSKDCTIVTASKCNSYTSCVACSTNGDCSHIWNNLNKCVSGICVRCAANSDCTSPYFSKCSSNTCVACSSADDCSHIINDRSTACTAGECVCTNNNGCLNPLASKCSADACISCSTNGDCTHIKGDEKVCNSGVCKQLCVSNINCIRPDKSKCVSGNCEDCQSNADCSHMTGFLTVCVLGNCQQCAVNQHCLSSYNSKCSSDYVCTFCKSNSDCAHMPGTSNTCQYGVCKDCTTNSDCTSVLASRCVGTACVACSTNGDCNLIASGNTCTSGICQKCATNVNCLLTSKSQCVSGVCSACTIDLHCSHMINGLNKCNNGQCGICVSNSDCTTPGLTKCKDLYCVQCLANTDCTTPVSSFCNDSGACVACSFNKDCSHVSGGVLELGLLYCASGICKECITSIQCNSDDKPLCNTNSCSDCNTNGDCSTRLVNKICANQNCVLCLTDGDCSAQQTNKFCASNSCMPCLTDNDCTSATASKCSANACVACTNDSECSHITGGVLGSGLKYCVVDECKECTTNSHCNSDDKSLCSLNICAGCITNSDCSARPINKFCFSTKCVLCLIDNDCTSATASKCSANACVTCTNDSECSHITGGVLGSGLKYCVVDECKECTTNSHCNSDDKSLCSLNICAGCITNSDCSARLINKFCFSTKCVLCLIDNDCTSATASKCSANACVACTNDSECSHITGGLNKCVNEQCKECLSNSDCLDRLISFCNTNNICSPCATDNECAHIPNNPFCITSKCYECNSNTNCQASLKSKCQLHICINCLSNEDCFHIPQASGCQEGVCVICLSNEDCPDSTTSRCDTLTHSCINCISNADCLHFSSKNQLCNNGNCVECVANGDCDVNSGLLCIENKCANCSSHGDCIKATGLNYCNNSTCSNKLVCQEIYEYHFENLCIKTQFSLFQQDNIGVEYVVQFEDNKGVQLQNIILANDSYEFDGSINISVSISNQTLLTIHSYLTFGSVWNINGLLYYLNSNNTFEGVCTNATIELPYIDRYDPNVLSQILPESTVHFANTVAKISNISGLVSLGVATPGINLALSETISVSSYLFLSNTQELCILQYITFPLPLTISKFLESLNSINTNFLKQPKNNSASTTISRVLEKVAKNKFERFESHSFFSNTWKHFLVVGGLAGCGLIAKWMRFINPQSSGIKKKFIDLFDFGIPLQAFFTTSNYMIICAGITIKLNDFSSFPAILNNIGAYITLLFYGIVLPCWYQYFVIQYYDEFDKPDKLINRFLYRGVRLNFFAQAYFPILMSTKKLLFMVALIFLQIFPYFILGFYLILLLLTAIWIIKYRPYIDNLNNISCFVTNTLMIVLIGLLIFIQNSDSILRMEKIGQVFVVIGLFTCYIDIILIVGKFFVRQYNQRFRKEKTMQREWELTRI